MEKKLLSSNRNILADLTHVSNSSFLQVKAHWRSFDRSEEWSAEIDHVARRWEARNLTSGAAVRYEKGCIVTDFQSYSVENYRDQAPAVVLQMLIPERLSVWGRPHDQLSPISVVELRDGTHRVTVQHREDHSIQEILVVDMQIGIVLKYYAMLSATMLEIVTTEQPPQQ